jgi:hypothetical protein
VTMMTTGSISRPKLNSLRSNAFDVDESLDMFEGIWYMVDLRLR